MEGTRPLRARGPDTPPEEIRDAFAMLGAGDFANAVVVVGRFDGDSGWERHVGADELVHVLEGATDFDLIVDDEIRRHAMQAGSLIVVPRGCWHRFRSEAGVTVLAVTPVGDEEHSFAEDPRSPG